MKIASRKKKTPSIAKAIPKASPKRSMNRGQSRPNSKERTVPVTAPTANSTATAFDQFRASRSASSSFRFLPLHSAISIIAGKATPRHARTMWNPSVNPIWFRAASRFDEVSARKRTGLDITRRGAYPADVVASRSQDRRGVERRSGTRRDAERSRREQKLPASGGLAARRQVLEQQVVEQRHPHRV